MSMIPFFWFFGVCACISFIALMASAFDGWGRNARRSLYFFLASIFMLTLTGSIYMGNDPLPTQERCKE